MKINLSFRGLDAHAGFERLVTRHCGKLEKLLTAYDPDLVQCHAAVEFHQKKNRYILSVNLVLPTATLHATHAARDVQSTVARPFRELEGQIKKHKAKLRHEHEWKRKRGRTLAPSGAF
ncbi:MAG TPA: HPF/RaiA family ribosome-associated protein [Candidatus Acidoferrales bacterium]|nr:HPF/RaiA family ribosome-associated protein [Candidatus Acidoferrales bacterium]